MVVHLTDDVGEFATIAEPFLRSEPFTANVIAVEVDGVMSGQRSLHPGSRWILIEERGQLVGVAMHTPPFNLFLPKLGVGVPEAVAGALWSGGHRFPGVSGEAVTVQRFVGAWGALGGAGSCVRVRTRMYVLGTLRPPEGMAGHGRQAVGADADLLIGWLHAFFAETDNVSHDADIDGVAGRRLADGQFWLWEDGGEPVSVAGVHPPAAGVARVGPVYTPGQRRGRGYGSAVAALASGAGMDRGAAHVVLYTDLSNPTSNAIYQAIGYMPDHDAEERDLLAG
ncbi:MAG: GNAT family N-acetyltransferase [Acidimicrobiales bacterium]